MTGADEAARAGADRRRCAVAALLALLMLAWGIADAIPFVTDDAFISLRYAERLLAGDGLTWTDGERVEGYSNLAWVLLCALLGATGLDLLLAARLLGVACTAATIWLLARRFRGTWAGALLAVAFAAAAPVPVWAIAGLELPLVLLAAVAGFLAWERDPPRGRARAGAGAWFALLCLTRPDSPLFAGIAMLGAVAEAGLARGRRWQALRGSLGLLLLPALAVLGQLAFRLAYYGEWLPNTARVKLAVGEAAWTGGLWYLQAALPVFAPLLPAALFGFAVALRGPRRVVPLALALAAAAWCVYVASVAGDFFPAWRLLAPALVPAVLLAALGADREAVVLRRPWPMLALALLAAAGLRVSAMADGQTARAATERWEQDNRAIGETLRSAFAGEQPLLAVDAAGALPFYSRLPCLDMLGLNDATIARSRALVGAKSAYLAAHHRGPPAYLLGRAPDLVFFDRPVPDDPSGMELLDDPRFFAGWRCVWFRCADATADRTADPAATELFAAIWVRIEGRVGVARGAASVSVPAWLLGSYRFPAGLRPPPPPGDDEGRRAWVQRWGADAAIAAAWYRREAMARPVDGALRLEVRAPGVRELAGLRLDAGTWRLRLEPETPHCEAELAAADGGALPRSSADHVVGEGGLDGAVLRLRVGTAAALPLRLRTIEILRL
jgi:hypothetical protein